MKNRQRLTTRKNVNIKVWVRAMILRYREDKSLHDFSCNTLCKPFCQVRKASEFDTVTKSLQLLWIKCHFLRMTDSQLTQVQNPAIPSYMIFKVWHKKCFSRNRKHRFLIFSAPTMNWFVSLHGRSHLENVMWSARRQNAAIWLAQSFVQVSNFRESF